MRASFKIAMFLLFFVLIPTSWADPAQQPWFTKGDNSPPIMRVDLFLSTTCPHCQHEDTFFRELQARKPWLDIHRYEINRSKEALEKFHQALMQQEVEDYSVPSVFFCNARWIGFDKAETTGKAIEKALDYCYRRITKTGQLKPSTSAVIKNWSDSDYFAQNLLSKSQSRTFIALAPLLDAFNSCSIFAVLALFAFLYLYKKKSIMIELGSTFIVILALTHFIQQSHPAFFYQNLSWLRIVAALVGLGLIILAGRFYTRKSSEQPGVIIPILVGFTALFLEIYQQNCQPNFALIFSQWLDAHQISPLLKQIYMILYNVVYIIPMIFIMMGIIYYRLYKKREKHKPLLTCLAWYLLLVIGVFMVMYPRGLSSFLLSLLVLILTLVAAWLTVEKRRI